MKVLRVMLSELHIDKCYKEGHSLNKDQNKQTQFLCSRILSRNVSETLKCKRGFIQANRPDGPKLMWPQNHTINAYKRCGRGGNSSQRPSCRWMLDQIRGCICNDCERRNRTELEAIIRTTYALPKLLVQNVMNHDICSLTQSHCLLINLHGET